MIEKDVFQIIPNYNNFPNYNTLLSAQRWWAGIYVKCIAIAKPLGKPGEKLCPGYLYSCQP